MAIEYYAGTPGPTINVTSPDEVYEALDLLHTQVIDNIRDTSPLLRILEDAMTAMDAEDLL